MKIFESIGNRVAFSVGITILVLQSVNLYFTIKEEKAIEIESQIHAARNTILMAESVRENMEKKWELGIFSPETIKNIQASSEEEFKSKLLATIPVVTAWESAKAKAKEAGFEFRTPRKGARNPDNEPDQVEQQALNFFKNNADAREYHVLDEEMNAIRYFRPVRLGEVCMNCHGDPANAEAIWGRTDGKDITGFAMDNKKVGDLHGAFEVIQSMDEADAALMGHIIFNVIQSLIGLTLAVLVVIFVTKKFVSRPLINALAVINQAEKNNDLRVKLIERGTGEVAEMSRAFNRFVSRIRSFVVEVNTASSEMAGSAEQMSQISKTTNDAVQLQQQESQSAATAMEEMATTVDEVAQSAVSAANAANAARTESSSGNAVVQETKSIINQLATDISHAADVIKALEKDSDAIGTVLDVIKGIAEQTNLLALNAAIEAARAGEQGRGFAVVADEVRSLAKRTQESTAEIEQMIEQLQSGARNAVEVMEQGHSQVDRSVEHASKASEALVSISSAISTIDDMNTQIASASEEQSMVANEVSQNVTKIYTASETTSDNTNQLAVASQQLDEMSRNLQQIVEKYRV